MHLRNTLHTRIAADAFVPCGGRPNVIHAGNWRDFLDDDGKPIRRYLTEPPVVYLDPDPESPVIITEKPKKKNRFNWPDIWPF